MIKKNIRRLRRFAQIIFRKYKFRVNYFRGNAIILTSNINRRKSA